MSRPENKGPFDWVTTFPKVIWDPRDPNEFDGLCRHGFMFWNEADEPTDEDGNDYYPLFHGAMFDELLGRQEAVLAVRTILKAGTYPPGGKKAGKVLSKQAREAFEREIKEIEDGAEDLLGLYEDLFGENARLALAAKAEELSSDMVEDEPLGQLALF